MQLTNFLPLVLVTLAAASPLVKRDAATVLADFVKVNTDITALYYAIGNYTGTLTQALTVAAATNTLDTSIKKTTTDTTSSTAFAAADSTSVTNQFVALTPRVNNVLTALKAKEPLFDEDGLNPTVVTQLKTLKTDSSAMATAIGAKVVSTDQSAVTTNSALVTGYLDAAIATFS